MKSLFGGLGVQEANPPNVQSFVLLLFEKMAQIRNGKELYQKPYDRKVKKLPKDFHAVKAPPPDLQAFYADGGDSFSGKPYRYDTGHTTHIWWTIR